MRLKNAPRNYRCKTTDYVVYYTTHIPKLDRRMTDRLIHFAGAANAARRRAAGLLLLVAAQRLRRRAAGLLQALLLVLLQGGAQFRQRSAVQIALLPAHVLRSFRFCCRSASGGGGTNCCCSRRCRSRSANRHGTRCCRCRSFCAIAQHALRLLRLGGVQRSRAHQFGGLLRLNGQHAQSGQRGHFARFDQIAARLWPFAQHFGGVLFPMRVDARFDLLQVGQLLLAQTVCRREHIICIRTSSSISGANYKVYLRSLLAAMQFQSGRTLGLVDEIAEGVPPTLRSIVDPFAWHICRRIVADHVLRSVRIK